MVPIDPFFSIKRFAHRALWKPGAAVWSPLALLDDYLKTQVLGKIEIDVPEGVVLINRETISIGMGTILEPGVLIQGPCVLGKECAIRHGALLRGGVICGDRCVIGHSAEIKHSILLDDAHATHFVYVGDSIVGNGANLAAGVKCANLRLDGKEVMVSFEGIKVATGLRKMGSIVGDRVQVGCNCVLNPGAMLGREAVCFPLLNFSGYAPPRSQIKGAVGWTVTPANAVELLEKIGH